MNHGTPQEQLPIGHSSAIRNYLTVSVLFFLFVPFDLLACGVCLDREILIRLPAIPWLLGLCGLWFCLHIATRSIAALARIIGKRFQGRTYQPEVIRPKKRWIAVGAVSYLILVFVAMGSSLGPAMVLVPVWLIALLAFIRSEVKARSPAKAARICFYLNVLFLAAAVLSIPYAYYRAYSVKHILHLLDYEVPTVSRILIPRILAKGDSAVEPLIEVTQEALKADSGEYDWIRRQQVVKYTAFCLGKIGGPKAVEFLRSIVLERIDFKEHTNRAWQNAVCAAYAQCAGPKAGPDLMALYDRCPAPPVDKWCVLAALARTGNRDGVNFTLNHIEVLFERAESGGAGDEIDAARATLGALVYGKTVDELRGIPLFRKTHMVGTAAPFASGDLRNEFYLSDYASGRMPNVQALSAEWQNNKEQIISRWEEVLK